MFGSRVISPFFSRAFRWHITPLGELMLKLLADFADRRAVAAIANLVANEFVDFALTFGKIFEIGHVRNESYKSGCCRQS